MSRSQACALFLTLLTGGSASAPPCHEGKLAVRYRAGEAAELVRVPYRADYALYPSPPPAVEGQPHADDVPGQALQPWTWLELRPGEAVGFQQGQDGELVAVAGPKRLPLPAGGYCWHITPETEYRGWRLARHQAQEVLVPVVCAPFRVAGEILCTLLLALGTPAR